MVNGKWARCCLHISDQTLELIIYMMVTKFMPSFELYKKLNGFGWICTKSDSEKRQWFAGSLIPGALI